MGELCNTLQPERLWANRRPHDGSHDDRPRRRAQRPAPSRILIRAARVGVQDYRRDRDLKRLRRAPKGSAPQAAIGTLLAEEGRLEAIRAQGEATYNLQRHVARC